MCSVHPDMQYVILYRPGSWLICYCCTDCPIFKRLYVHATFRQAVNAVQTLHPQQPFFAKAFHMVRHDRLSSLLILWTGSPLVMLDFSSYGPIRGWSITWEFCPVRGWWYEKFQSRLTLKRWFSSNSILSGVKRLQCRSRPYISNSTLLGVTSGTLIEKIIYE